MRRFTNSIGQRRMKKIRKVLISVGLYLAGLLLCIFLGVMFIRYYGVKTVVLDQSMMPTLEKEDAVLVDSFSYKAGSPKRQDIIAFKIGSSANSTIYVRRVIGIPGDTIRIENGILYVNDVETELSFNTEAIADPGAAENGVTLDEDTYFVLCDNYNNSRDDSRLDSIGMIDKEQIQGKVWMIWQPRSRFGLVH